MKKQILALIMAVAMVFSTPMPVMASESSDDVIETPVHETEATSEEPEKASAEADSEKSKDNTQVESNESQAESESVEEEEALEEELVVEEDEEEKLLEAEEEVTDPEVIVTYKDVTKKFENCLLYTSPSPRDKRQSRMPSSA